MSNWGSNSSTNKLVDTYLKGFLDTSGGDVFVQNGNVYLYNTLDSVNASSGTLQVRGGAGIGGNLFVGGNSTVSGNVVVSGTTISTSTSTGALRITGGAGIGGNVFIGGNSTVSGNIISNSGTASTSTSTGALLVSGGAGIGGNLFVGGNSTVSGNIISTSTTVSTSTSTGALQVSGGAGIGGNLFVGGNSTVSGNIISTSTTVSTSTSTGALLVSGGAGIGGNLFVGGNSTVSGNIISTSTTVSTSTSTGALQVSGGAGIGGNLFVGGNSTVSGSIISTNVTASTSTSTGALQVSGGAGIGGNLFVGGNSNVTGSITTGLHVINSTTASTSTSTGALQVSGGAGIGGNLFVGGNSTVSGSITTGLHIINSTVVSTSTSTGALQVSGGAGIGGNLFVGGNSTVSGSITTGQHVINSTTASTSTSTGALQVSGGAGIGGNLFVGGNSTVSGSIISTNVTASTSTSTGALQVSGGAGIGGNLFVGGNSNVTGSSTTGLLVINSTVVSTSTSTGALQVSGGAGIGGNLFVGGNSNVTGSITTGLHVINSTTASTSTSTGALQVSGGAGIGGNLFVGGNSNVTGSSTTGLLVINSTTASTSTSTGALQVSGGAGIGGNLFVGGNSNVTGSITTGIHVINSTTASTSTSTGALQVSGGAGIGGNLYVGGGIDIFGSANFKTIPTSINPALDNSSNQLATTAFVKTNINTLIGGAGPLFDTLKEIQTALNDDPYFNTTINNLINLNNTLAVHLAGDETITGLKTFNADVSMNTNLRVGGTIYGNISGIFNGTISSDQAILANSTVASTSTDTGSLIVKGGAGIGGNLFVGGNSTVSGSIISTNVTASTSTSTGALRVSGGAGIGGNLFVGGNSTVSGSIISTNVTASTSTSTGALRVSGGAGIGGNLFVGGNSTVSGSIISTNVTASTSTSTGALQVSGGAGIGGNLYVGGNTITGLHVINSTIVSTSTSTGALVVSGGAGIGGNLFVGDNISISDGTIKTTGIGLRQPPSPMTANVTNIPGHGVYYAYNSTQPYEPNQLSYSIFDYSNSTAINSPYGYNTLTGDPSINTWNFADTISDINGTAYPGYRCHIDLPYQINLTSFSYDTGPGRVPVQGFMLASNGDNRWTNIYSFDLSATINNSTMVSISTTSFSYNFSNSSFFSKYALVIKSIASAAGASRFTMFEVNLFGNNNILSTQGIGATSIGVSELLSVGNTANITGNLTVGNIGDGFIKNNSTKLLISEPIGTVASASSGTLMLQHGNPNGASSLVFKSTVNNFTNDYGYIQYDDNIGLANSTYAWFLNDQYTTPVSVLSTGVFPVELSANNTNVTSLPIYRAGAPPAQLTSLEPYCIAFNQTNISLDASSNINYLQTTPTVNPYTSGGFTFSAWIRALDGSGNKHILDISPSGFASTLSIYINPTSRIVAAINGDVSNNIQTTFSMINYWFHYAFTFNNTGSVGTHYISGSSVTTTTNGTGYTGKTLVGTNQIVTIGAKGGNLTGTGGNKGFNGNMVFVNLFDRVLTQPEIALLFNSPGNSQFNSIERGLLTIGIENDNNPLFNDRISLFAAGGSGFVGVNTKGPTAHLDVSGNVNVSGKAVFGAPPTSTTYDFDVSGQMRIYETTGSAAGVSTGSLVLEHGDASGQSSIVFRSKNGNNDYGYIQYQENVGGSAEKGLLTIGIENNDAGNWEDRISLFAAGGSGFVGVNTKNPTAHLDVSGSTNVSGSVVVSGTTASTSTSTGALQVSGGAGIGGNLFVGGNSTVSGSITTGLHVINSTTASTSTSTGALQVSGGAGIGGNLFVGGNSTVSGSITTGLHIINSTVVSTSTSTGALQVSGGAGIGGNLFVGGNINVSGNSIVTGNSTVSGNVVVSGTTNSASTSTGALLVSGGVGIAKSLFVGANINAAGKATFGTPPTSTTYELDVSGQMRIYETVGSAPSTSTGSLVFEHGDASGQSSIVFKSKNNSDSGSDYAYIQYQENVGGTDNAERALLTIGIENDVGSGNTSDRISLFAAGGSGFVGVNTKNPTTHLDVSGSINISNTITTTNYSSNNFIGGNVNLSSPIPVMNTIFANTAVISASSVTLSGVTPSFYNGVYEFSASSFLTPWYPYRVFDNNAGTFWRCDTSSGGVYDQNPYSITTPFNYQGGTSGNTAINFFTTTISNGMTVSGEWIQIKTPVAYGIKNYSIKRSGNTGGGGGNGGISNDYKTLPSEFYLLGSNNGTTWDLIDFVNEQENIIDIGGNSELYNYTLATKSSNYNHFRFVITKLKINNLGFLAISDIELNGEPSGYSVGKTTIGNDLQLYGKVIANDTEVIGNILFRSRVKQDYKDVSYTSLNGFYALDHKKAPITDINNSLKAVSTWTPRYSPGATVNGICWSSALRIFCAVGTQKSYTSANGIDWTVSDISSNTSLTYRSVVWAPELNLFCAVAAGSALANSSIAVSSNGTTWDTNITHDISGIAMYDIAWSPELRLFNIIGGSSSHFYYSSDGYTWTRNGVGNNAYSIVWASSLKKFVSITTAGAILHGFGTSIFNEWITLKNGTHTSNPYRLIWASPLNMLVAYGGVNIFISYDAYSWTMIQDVTLTGVVNGTWSDELGIFCLIDSSTPKRCYISNNGITWISTEITATISMFSDQTGICWSPELGIFCVSPGASNRSFLTSSLTERIPTAYNMFNSSNGIQSVDENGNLTFNKNTTIGGTITTSNYSSNNFIGGNVNLTLPVPVMNKIFASLTSIASSSVTISGVTPSFYNGVYDFSASSNISGEEPYKAFNENASTFWSCDTSGGTRGYNQTPYSTISPFVYQGGTIGSTTTNYFKTLVGGQTISGEWLQIKTPIAYGIMSYSITRSTNPANGHKNMPSEFYLAGSNDGTTWSLIDYRNENQNLVNSNGSIYSYDFNFTLNTKSANYTFFRLIPTKLKTGTSGFASIAELYLYGDPSGYSMGKTTITNDLQLLGKVFANNTEVSGNMLFRSRVKQDYKDVSYGSMNGFYALDHLKAPVTNIENAKDAVSTWTPRFNPGVIVQSICWSSTLRIFCAVGSRFSYTSPDGINWTTSDISSNVGLTYRDVVWAPELNTFCAVAGGVGNANSLIALSSNGTTWNTNTTHSATVTIGFYSVSWSPELKMFTAVGGRSTSPDNGIMYSYDGLTWTSKRSGNALYSIVWANSLKRFVFVNNDGTITLYDGTNSIETSIVLQNALYNSNAIKLVWSPQLNMLVGFSGSALFTSYDGFSWTMVQNLVLTGPTNCTWSAELGVFCVIDSASKCYISNDGVNWSIISISATLTNINTTKQLCWSPELGIFCFAPGLSGHSFLTSSLRERIPTAYNLFNSSNGIQSVDENGNWTFNKNTTVSGNVVVSGTTDSASTSTGALLVSGGVGIAKSLFVGSNLSTVGKATFGTPPTSTTYELDVSGQMRIFETTGSVAGTSTGSLVLERGNASGHSSIVFRSANSISNYGYIQYKDNDGNMNIGSNVSYSPLTAPVSAVSVDVSNQFTSNTVNISGVSPSFYNGTYNISASSNNSTGWNAFDNTITTLWQSVNLYSSTSPFEYIGTIKTTVQSIGDVSGEWIQIMLPYSFNITSYVVSSYGSGHNPAEVHIVGSNDNNVWYLVHTSSTHNTASPILNLSFNVSNSNYYTTYRLIIRKLSANALRPAIVNLSFYGYPLIGTTIIENNMDVNGKMRVYETVGSTASASTGSLVLSHGDASGASSLVFRSINNAASDYAYIQYEENVGGSAEKGLLTIGIENESGSANTSDRISLFSAGGSGFVGVNTKNPTAHLDVSGSTNVSGSVVVSGTTASTSTSTGALRVSGGAGIGGNLFVGGNSTVSGNIISTGFNIINSTTASTSTSTGALQVSGGAGIGGNLFVGGNSTVSGSITTGQHIINSTTASTSTSTGALQVSGGAGIGGNLFVGGNSTVSGSITTGLHIINSTVVSTSTSTGALQVSGGAGIGGNLFVGGNSTVSGSITTGQHVINSTTASTSTSTGALQVSGGAGIGGNLFVGGNSTVSGNIISTNVTASTSTSTGALQVSGGAGIGGNLFVGGNLAVTGTSSFTTIPTAPTSVDNSSNQLATTAYVRGAINNLVNGAGSALDTLYELASAINNDPSFNNTIITAIGNRALDSTVVHLTGTETITGLKTFSAVTTVSNGTESTSTGSGALQVTGGIGVSKNLSVGGKGTFGVPPANTTYELDVSGQMRIYETVGTAPSDSTGSLVLEHGDASGQSSIVFRSKNGSNDYAYIQYQENVGGPVEKGLLTIGIENNPGSGPGSGTYDDRISLFAAGGSGFIGVNTKNPNAHLDVSGNFNISNYSSNNFIGGNVNLTLPIPVMNRIFANTASINASSVTISGITPSFYNGVYDFSASSFVASGDPYRAFDENISNSWTCDTSGGTRGYNQTPYLLTTPFTYRGGTIGSTTTNYFTTIVDGVSISGEWLQIKTPTAFNVTSYSLSRGSFGNNSHRFLPSEFYLVGSNNGTTWTLLDFRNEVQNFNRNTLGTTEMNFTINKTTAYTHFRIINTKVRGTTSTFGYISIGDFRLFGEPAGYSMGKTTVTNDLQLFGKVFANDTEVSGNVLFINRVKQDYKDASYSSLNGFYALDHQKAPITNFENAKLAVSTWSAVYSPTLAVNTAVSTVCWSSTLRIFCAVGTNKSYTSPDGMSWTVSDISSNISMDYRDVVWAPELGIFCAVGAGLTTQATIDASRNLIATSSNGVSWNTNITHGGVQSAQGITAVAWSPELRMFNAIGTSGNNGFLYSYDGINWTSLQISSNYYGLVWAPDLKCFVFLNSTSGGGGVLLGNSSGTGYSSEVLLANALYDSTPRFLMWSSQLKMLVAYGSKQIYTSYDGINWITVPNITLSGEISFGTWSAELGMFLIIDPGTKIVYVSSNGITWSSFNVPSLPILNTSGRFAGRRMCWSPELGIFCFAPSAPSESFSISSLRERIPTAYNLFNSNNGIQSVDQSGNWTFNKNTTVSGNVVVSGTTDSASTSTGALLVSGGVGIAKSLFVGSNLNTVGKATFGTPPTSTTYELDVSGQMRIFETTGSVAGTSTGSLVLERGNASGHSSIVFRSASNYGYIQYKDNDGNMNIGSNVSYSPLTAPVSAVSVDVSNQFTQATVNISGISPSFYNGTYNISASSNNFSAQGEWNVFDNSLMTIWSSAVNQYNTVANIEGLFDHIGTAKTVVQSIGDVSGQWLQIMLPYSFNLTSYSIRQNGSPGFNPAEIHVVGSNDNIVWYLVHTSSTHGNFALSETKTFTVLNSNYYRFYRLIVRKLFSSQGRVALGNVLFYGYPLIGTTIIENNMNVNGQMRVYETVGSTASASTGSLVLSHGDASGQSSIVFRSNNNNASDYAYIQYQENVGGSAEKGLLTIGIENESGSANTSDRISLFSAGGSGFVGVNTKNPTAHLDVSGSTNVSGSVVVSGTTASTSTSTGALQVSGGAGIGGNLFVGGNSTVSGNIISTGFNIINSTVASTSTSTGALQVSGGAGIGGNLFVGGNSTVSGKVGLGITASTIYELDISGQVRIFEVVGSDVSSNLSNGSLTLEHADGSGCSSIMFKGPNTVSNGDYAYIKYQDNESSGLNSGNRGLLTIGIENDASSNPVINDSISLYAAGGLGYVGVNTKAPTAALDVVGDFKVSGLSNLRDVGIHNGVISGAWAQRGQDLSGTAASEAGSSCALSSNGTIVAVGSRGFNTNQGRVQVYNYNGSVWSQIGADLSGSVGSADKAGFSVALSSNGTTVVVGSTGYTVGALTSVGRAQVFNYNGSVWTQVGADLSGTIVNENAGLSVDISTDGTIVAVGSRFISTNTGRTRVYSYSGTVWNQLGSDLNTGGAAAFTVCKLSANGQIVAVSSGSFTQIYRYNGSSWTQLGSNLDGANRGLSLSSSGTIVGIGNINGNFGKVYSFNNNVWTQLGSTILGDTSPTSEQLGYDVALSSTGTTFAISTIAFASGTGRVKVYDWISNSWVQRGLVFSGTAANQYTGFSVELSSSGTVVAVGSNQYLSSAGRVQVYGLDKLSISAYGSNFIGINNPNPLYTLDVSGSIRVSEEIVVGSKVRSEYDVTFEAFNSIQFNAINGHWAGKANENFYYNTSSNKVRFIFGNDILDQWNSLDINSTDITFNGYSTSRFNISNVASTTINSQTRIFETGSGSVAGPANGSLVLEHANTGGASSLVLKASNSSTTADYAYIQYEDNTGYIPAVLKYDLSASYTNTDLFTNGIPSTGSNTLVIKKASVDMSINSVSVSALSPPVQFPAGVFCLSFNQYNLTTASTATISYIQTGSINPFSTGFTFSAWIRPTTVLATNCRFYILNISTSSATSNFDIYIDGDNGRISAIIGQDDVNFKWSNILSANEWRHYAFTFDNATSSGNHYLDGALVTGGVLGNEYAGDKLTATNQVILMGLKYGYNNGATIGGGKFAKGFNGYMNFVNMFNRALTADDIAVLYNTPGYTQTSVERGLMTIGIENDAGNVFNDRIVLWPASGTGFVGINTKTPAYTLDVSGNVNATSYNATSDYRIKENVVPLDLNFSVDVLNPVSYNLKNDESRLHIGFIAHEVQEVYPFLVNGAKDGATIQSINYNGFIGILTKEIQVLKRKDEENREKIVAQESKIVAQESKIVAQESKIVAQESKIVAQEVRIQRLEEAVADLMKP